MTTKPEHPDFHWDSAALDLDAYLTRIGFTGERTPTLETLRALQFAHTTTIPFENLEIILGRPIRLDLESLQDKLIHRRRGGYCYEQVLLFAAALERLGFGVTGLVGRVQLGADGLRPPTHSLLRVTTADDPRPWLCDVGFGAGPLAPLELSAGDVLTGDWRFRLERTLGELDTVVWILHYFANGGWASRIRFTENPSYRIDFAVANHFVSTSPRSPFVSRPFIQRMHPDVHHTLDATTWTTDHPDGSARSHHVTPADLPDLLTEIFDIDLTPQDADALVLAPWAKAHAEV